MHSEAMPIYLDKSGFKQAIRNMPIKFGFKALCLCTIMGYMFTFDLY
jgi:hypothetical protein